MTMAKLIGNRIRLRRSILRLSQEALGIMLTPRVKQQVMSKMERGYKEPSASQLFQIAHHLEVPISYFFEDIEPMKPSTAKGAVYQPLSNIPPVLPESKVGDRNS